MSVTIGHIIFDGVRYDADADVLYLQVETPEGHAVRFDAEGRVVGVTLVGVRRLLDEDGEQVGIGRPAVDDASFPA